MIKSTQLQSCTVYRLLSKQFSFLKKKKVLSRKKILISNREYKYYDSAAK